MVVLTRAESAIDRELATVADESSSRGRLLDAAAVAVLLANILERHVGSWEVDDQDDRLEQARNGLRLVTASGHWLQMHGHDASTGEVRTKVAVALLYVRDAVDLLQQMPQAVAEYGIR